MVNYKKIVNKKDNEAMEALDEWNEFIEANDIKKLIAQQFELGFRLKPSIFGKSKPTDLVGFEFKFGKYMFRMFRRPIGSMQTQTKDTMLQNLLNNIDARKAYLDQKEKIRRKF